MYNRVQAKEDAKSQLKGNWVKVGFIYLVLSIITIIATWIPGFIGFIVALLIAGSITLSYVFVAFKVRDGEVVYFEDVFSGFKHTLKALQLYLWQTLWVILWSLLFIIPGIIKGYSYRLAFYVLADDPETDFRTALDKSKMLTEGYKLDLFIADLSFVGWSILCLFTFGIGYFWLSSYIQVTYANLYKQILEAKQ